MKTGISAIFNGITEVHVGLPASRPRPRVLSQTRSPGKDWRPRALKGMGGSARAASPCRVLSAGRRWIRRLSPRAIPRLTLLETGLLADTGDWRNRRLMPEESRQVGQDRVFAISIGEQRLVGRYRPGDAESRIAPQ